MLPLGDQLQHLSGIRVSADILLGEDEISIDRHLEHAARSLDQFDLGVGVLPLNLGRQTGGPWSVVSDCAILDTDFHHASGGHGKRSGRP